MPQVVELKLGTKLQQGTTLCNWKTNFFISSSNFVFGEVFTGGGD